MMGSGSGLLLLGVISGYWMLERAETHKGELRRIGRILGAVLIVVSLLGAVFRGWTACHWMKHRRGMGGWSCPFMSKPAPAPAPALESEQESEPEP